MYTMAGSSAGTYGVFLKCGETEEEDGEMDGEGAEGDA